MSQTVEGTSNTSLPKQDPSHEPSVSRNGYADKSAMLRVVYEPIKNELAEVEAILQRELESDAASVQGLLEHSRLLGGKRLRPVLLLLSAAACGKIQPAHLKLAASLEMIHTATLIHDDVLDDAGTRRHMPTANSQWGNKASVLLGDYLFTHAFHLATFAESAPALRFLSYSSNRVCGGEMRQNAWIGNFDLTEEDYLQMISDKTAELCSCGCLLGALISGADEALVERYESFGRDLGVAFQIIDDILDLIGQTSEVGKTLGTDLTNRKPTLPVIHCLANLDAKRRNELIGILERDDVSVEVVMPYLLSTDSIKYARQTAAQFGTRASQFAQTLPENEYSLALNDMAAFVLHRSH